MDYELFVESHINKKSLADTTEKIVKETVGEKVTMQSDEEEIIIGNKYFSLTFEMEDISDIAFVRNHYRLDINVCIRVELYGDTFYQGLELLFKVIGKLMKQTVGNLLFLENGSDQLLRKENGQLIVQNNLDQYQKRYLTQSLLSLLDYSYIEKRLSN